MAAHCQMTTSQKVSTGHLVLRLPDKHTRNLLLLLLYLQPLIGLCGASCWEPRGSPLSHSLVLSLNLSVTLSLFVCRLSPGLWVPLAGIHRELLSHSLSLYQFSQGFVVPLAVALQELICSVYSSSFTPDSATAALVGRHRPLLPPCS